MTTTTEQRFMSLTDLVLLIVGRLYRLDKPAVLFAGTRKSRHRPPARARKRVARASLARMYMTGQIDEFDGV